VTDDSGYRLLSSDEAQDLLGELLDRLASRGIEVDAYLVGGVAVAIQLERSSLTPDVDGWFAPYDEVKAEAARMADEHDLAPDWVNKQAFAFIEYSRDDDVDAATVLLRGRPVRVASKQALLAMKIGASRRKDREDISRLIRALGIDTADELIAITRRFFAEESMTLPSDPDELRLIADEAIVRAHRTA
jgi:hypothetical protein